MMNWLPVVGLALVVTAPGVKDPPKKAEVPAIVGEWECIELIARGRKLTAAELATLGCGYEFMADGKVRSRFGGDPKDGTYTTAPAKDPAEVDFQWAKNQTTKGGIYKIDKDSLTLCYTEGKGERPAKFESPAGSRIMLMTFKRVEKKKE